MAVNDDRGAQSMGSPAVRDTGGAPGRHETDGLAATRRLVALAVSVTFLIIAVLIVIGGLVGRFDQALVGTVVTALAGAAGAVWAHLFHRGKAGGE